MTALEQWHQEISAGKRTASAPLDDLWERACREVADAEFAREVGIPHRREQLRRRLAGADTESERDEILGEMSALTRSAHR